MQPAQTTLRYTIPNGTSYIDLAQGLSAVNRRLYRQGYQYAVAGITMKAAGQGAIQFATAGDTWVVHNAWKTMQKCWIQQQQQTRDDECGVGQSVKPKWEDFKVLLDDGHAAGTIITPTDGTGAGTGALVGLGEWDYSKIVWDNDGTIQQPVIHLIGPSTVASTVGLITEYERSRRLQSTNASNAIIPDGASDSIYARLHGSDDQHQEIIENMEDDNSSPPYDNDDYVGNASNADEPFVQALGAVDAALALSTAGGFMAECGLVRVWQNTGANIDALIHLVPGNYRGVLAEPMGQ